MVISTDLNPQEKIELIQNGMPPIMGALTTSLLFYTGLKATQAVKKIKTKFK